MHTVVVANPIRRAAEPAVARLRRRATVLGMEPPHVEWTTPGRDGAEQAAAAVAAGARLVIACGGDGTVRRVVGALVGTDAHLGILPVGRGNVAAHNLGMSRRRLDATLLGTAEPCDLLQLEVELADGTRRVEWCLSMAGLGWDARAISGMAGEGSWPGYFTAGLRYLGAPGIDVRITTPTQRYVGPVWSVFLGNLPSVPPGIRLFDGAGPGSGLMTVAAVAPGGLTGWPGLALRRILARPSEARYAFRHTAGIELTPSAPCALQVDGDVIDDVVSVRAQIRPAAVQVRGMR